MKRFYSYAALILMVIACGNTYAQTRAQRSLAVGPSADYNGYFGPCVIKDSGWDRYLMFFSANSAVSTDGKPTNSPPFDTDYKNYTCPPYGESYGYWADRVWMSWHFGDGKTFSGWGADDGNGNVGPFLVLDIGGQFVHNALDELVWYDGAGESALIGDPTVVYWEGQFHMFYEGTDQCDGNDNRIFHAIARDGNWFNGWEKQGEVQGLIGSTGGSAISWPMAYIEDGDLYLYFNDGCINIRAAVATDATGHNFAMVNYDNTSPTAADSCAYNNPQRITNVLTPRAQVAKLDDSGNYIMVYEHDRFGGGDVYYSISQDKFNFPAGTPLLAPRNSTPRWEDYGAGLPCYIQIEGEHRIYYTGERLLDPNYDEGELLPSGGTNFRQGSIGVYSMPTSWICSDADANNDNRIDLMDYSHIAENWQAKGLASANADITGNGEVDFNDLYIFFQFWLENCF